MSGKSDLIGAGAHHRARQQVGAGPLALLGDRDRHLAELLGELRVVAEQLAEAHGRGQPRGAGADDQHPDVDALVLRRLRRDDVVGGLKGGG